MQKRLLSGYVAVLIMIFLLIAACEYEFIEPEKVIIPEVISFQDDIQPIFDGGCNISGCHAAGFAILDLSPANAYNDLFRKNLINLETPDMSGLYIKLEDGQGTHRDRSTATEQALILEWITKGAQNN